MSLGPGHLTLLLDDRSGNWTKGGCEIEDKPADIPVTTPTLEMAPLELLAPFVPNLNTHLTQDGKEGGTLTGLAVTPMW